MMTNPNTYKTPHQTAKEQAEAKNADVLRVLAAHKKALTPTEIAHAIQTSRGGECWCMRKYPGQKPIADTSRIGAVLRRIKAQKKRPKYAGRPASASPATGLASQHKAQQEALVNEALTIKGN